MNPATILIVDDEPSVLEFVGRALACSGYNVLAAHSGSEALAIVKTKRRIHVLVSDVDMPGMGGPELLRFVEKLSPSTATVLMSGHASVEEIDMAVPLVRKPFSLPALIRAVKRALQSHRSADLPSADFSCD